MWTWLLLSLVAMATPILSGSSVRLAEKDDCDVILADAINKFVTSSVGHSHNFLLWMLGVEQAGAVGVESVRRLGRKLSLDLVDPGQQRELAIILCHAPTLTYLSRTFDVTFESLDGLVERYVSKVYVHRKLDALFVIGGVIMELLEWTRLTGYPLTPLRHQSAEDALSFLSDMEERLDVCDDVRDTWLTYNRHFPVGLGLDRGEVALYLSGAHSLTSLSEFLDLPALELETLSRLDDVMLHQYAANVGATLRLYRVLQQYGVLSLEWK